MEPHPVTLSTTGELTRNRLTVFFRLILVIPHLIVLYIWSVLALVLTLINWIIALITGRVPTPLHNFVAGLLKYSTRVSAYVMIGANGYPPFSDAPYEVTLSIAPPAQQNRWKTLFRLVLGYPALLVFAGLTYVTIFAWVFGWWVSLILGRTPLGLRNWIMLYLEKSAQSSSYLYMLTDRYPEIDPFARVIPGVHATSPVVVTPPVS